MILACDTCVADARPLFGLQHLSAFALTSRGAGDILMNVLLSGVYGFALAAYQLRFRWIRPLILVHALADFTTVLAIELLPDLLVGVSHVLLPRTAAGLRHHPAAGFP